MQRITPFLWFDRQAEQATKFYVSLFRNSKIVSVSRYGVGAPLPKGSVKTVEFLLGGQRFIALNGGAVGPDFKFTWGVSLLVDCKDQREVDRLWKKLTTNGGKEGQCGWLKDKYGLAWQVIPRVLERMLNDPDPEKASRVMSAMLKMNKLVIEDLELAYRGRSVGPRKPERASPSSIRSKSLHV